MEVGSIGGGTSKLIYSMDSPSRLDDKKKILVFLSMMVVIMYNIVKHDYNIEPRKPENINRA